jgi:hypothetical protein
LPTCLLLSGCGDKTPQTPEDSAIAPAKEAPALPAAKTNEKDFVSRDELKTLKGKGCELLPLAPVKKLVGNPDAEIQNLSIMGCQYSWEKPNSAEISAQNQALVVEGMAKGMSIMEIGRQQQSTDNNVSLYMDTFSANQDAERLDTQFRNMTNRLTDEEKARNAEAMAKVMTSLGKNNAATDAANKALDDMEVSDAVKEGAKDILNNGPTEEQKAVTGGLMAAIQEEAAQEIYNDVPGIGTRAAWSDYADKLVVQHRNLFFTLTVAIGSDEENREAAKSLASVVIGNIDDHL